MDKIIKEVLTNKKVRDHVALVALVVTVMDAGSPWFS
jgi:hypothetical protein